MRACSSAASPRRLLLAPLLLLVATAPGAAFELAIDPPRPDDTEPFELAIGGDGSCPAVVGVRAPLPDDGVQVIEVLLEDGCLSPPSPFLLEVPFEPLASGAWRLDVAQSGSVVASQPLTVVPRRFALAIDPPHPTVGWPPPRLVFRGMATTCPGLSDVRRDGFLLTAEFREECVILPPPPEPFVIEQELPPIEVGSYRAQVESRSGETLATLRFDVRPYGACVPDAEEPYSRLLCLHGGRFRVTATWGDEPADAYVLPQSDGSGTFWFFRPENVELLVKVIDACSTPRRRFWVFASGLTNLEVHLTVVDTVTGHVWERTKPPGMAFPPVLDTDAFATCDGIVPPPAG